MESTLEEKNKLSEIFAKFIMAILIYNIGHFLLAFLVADEGSAYFLLLVIISQFLLFLAPIIYFAKKFDYPLGDTFRWHNKSNFSIYIWAMIGLIGLELFTSGYISLLISSMPEFLSNYLRSSYAAYIERFVNILGMPTPVNIILSLSALALTPAICEELIFRGYLQKSLERIINVRKSIIVTSIIFSAIHFNIELFIPLFVAGLLLGYFAHITKSIYPSILIHFLLNASSIFMYYFNKESVLELTVKTDISIWDSLGYFLSFAIGLYLIYFAVKKVEKQLFNSEDVEEISTS